jgi:hypothetical protein
MIRDDPGMNETTSVLCWDQEKVSLMLSEYIGDARFLQVYQVKA